MLHAFASNEKPIFPLMRLHGIIKAYQLLEEMFGAERCTGMIRHKFVKRIKRIMAP